MDKHKVLAKVSKLLALANSKGASPNEVETALRQARALMSQYNLESTDIEASQVNESSIATKTQRSPAHWQHSLASTCASAFDASHLSYYHHTQGWSFKFIGLGVAPELAAHTYSGLLHQLLKARREHVAAQRRCNLATKRRRGQIFAEAWISAVSAKVRQFATGLDASTSVKVSAYLERHHPNLKQFTTKTIEPKGYDNRSSMQGWEEGSQAKFHRGVSGQRPIAIGQGGAQ